MGLTLYKLSASPPVRSVLMTMDFINISGEVDFIDIDLLAGDHLKEEFLKINPQHTIPTLIDGDFVLWDSHAIVSYLVTKYDDDDFLYPLDSKRRAIVDQRLHFDSGILFPALRGTIEPVIFHGEKHYRQENLVKINMAYALTEKILTAPWLAGDQITLADICCIATISTMHEVVPVSECIYPGVAAWMKRCSEQDFFKTGNAPGLEMFRQLLKSKFN